MKQDMNTTKRKTESPDVPAEWVLSERLSRCSSSPLRDIFTAIERPGVISFAGGLPDQAYFPDLADCLGKNDAGALARQNTDNICQYGASNGERELRGWVADYISGSGLSVKPEQIIILSGSQQGIDLCAKLLVDHGTAVSVFYPTYLAALQSFTLFGAEYRCLASCSAEQTGNQLDCPFDLAGSPVAYINPTFSNPSSSNLSLQQRRGLALGCDAHNTVLIEDDAYRELFYEDCERQPVCSFMQRSGWIYLSSFSKTIAPGLRLGFMAVCEELLPYMTRLKQAADLHSSRIAQHCVIQWLQQNDQQLHLQQLRDHYKYKRDRFDAELGKNWSDIADWERPAGGMFFWLKLKHPLSIPMSDILSEAIGLGVAFMPGEYFYPPFSSSVANTGSTMRPEQMIRLNFTNASVAEARYGLEKLAELLRRHQLAQTPR